MSKLNTVQNGKGDKPRPIKNIKEYNDNFDLIFRKKKKKVLEKEEKSCDNV
jgi:hypothetical protein